MSDVGQIERHTQNRIVKLFTDESGLGYINLGNWEDNPNNNNIEELYLKKYLVNKACYTEVMASRAIYKLKAEANNADRNLYNNNKEVYKLLRYGVEVSEGPGERYQRIHFINWDEPEKNHFGIAEEVTFHGYREKRPDIVLYVNGIALVVLELKRSTVTIGNGIRQSIVNQQKQFIEEFFPTIQLVMAGNDTEGLRYGTIGTPEKFFLRWKEDEEDSSQLQLDKYLAKICNKKRLLEIIHDFVLFDGVIISILA